MFWSIKPEEQEMLQYYFTDVAPLLDNLKNSPLAGLAITYCTRELALSCFLCLAHVHLATRQGSEACYANGLEYHSRTIRFLGEVLSAVSSSSTTTPNDPGATASAATAVASSSASSAGASTSSAPMQPSQSALGLPNIQNIRNQTKMGRGLGVAVLTVIYFLITFEVSLSCLI